MLINIKTKENNNNNVITLVGKIIEEVYIPILTRIQKILSSSAMFDRCL